MCPFARVAPVSPSGPAAEDADVAIEDAQGTATGIEAPGTEPPEGVPGSVRDPGAWPTLPRGGTIGGGPARVPRLPRRSAKCRALVVMEPQPLRAPEVLSLQIRGDEGISMALSSNTPSCEVRWRRVSPRAWAEGLLLGPRGPQTRALDVASRERRRAACGTDGRGAGLRVQRVSRSRLARRGDAVFRGGPSLPRASPATVCQQDCMLGPQAVWGAGGCAASSQEAKKYKVTADEPEGFGG